MSTTSNRMLIACLGAFLVSSTLVACGVFAALCRAEGGDSVPRGSDHEVEQAAMAVVRPYYNAVDEIGADGGINPQRINRFVTKMHGSQLAVAFAGMTMGGWKTSGKSVIVGDKLIARRIAKSTGAAEAGVRVCLDVSHTRVIGSAREGQALSKLAKRVPYDVWLTTGDAGSKQLRIESTRVREELAPC